MNKGFYSLLLTLFLLSFTQSASAQGWGDYEDLRYRKWRVTLFPPLSTNGIAAKDYTARYSINLLAGYHGGLDGIEYGTLFNYTRKYARGFQLAGLANVSGGSLEGINIAGLGNVASGSISGIQVSGLGNISKGSLDGIQAAGLLNYSGRSISGIQLAGAANVANRDLSGLQSTFGVNYATESISGIQAAGIANVGRENLEGIQFSSVFNAAGGDVSGIQVSGLFNYGYRLEGIQTAAGVNIAREDLNGIQFAGIGNFNKGESNGIQFASGINYAGGNTNGIQLSNGINISSREFNGIQMAGIWKVSGRLWDRFDLEEVGDVFDTRYNIGLNVARYVNGIQLGGINITKEINGLQVGLINLGENIEGAPVGLISLYKNGRHNVDVRFSDAGFTDVGLNLGTHRVYNMVFFGFNPLLEDVYRVGWSIGVERRFDDIFYNANNADDLFIDQEFSITHQFTDELDGGLDFIFSYKYLFGKYFGENFAIYGGPSLNAQITRNPEANEYTWYSIWSPDRNGRQYRFWIGATVGIRFFKQKRLETFNTRDWNFSDEWDID